MVGLVPQILFVVGFGLFGQLLTAADQNRCASASIYRDRAVKFYRQHDLPSATSQLREAVLSCPAEPFYRFMLANALYRAGSLQESASTYRAFLQLRPNHFEAHMSLGFTIFELGDLKGAIRQWSDAVEIEPESPFARAALAVGLYSAQDSDDARIQYERAVELDARYLQPNDLAVDIRWRPAFRTILNTVKELTPSEGDK